MKIRFDIDCTPEEARRFLGLPDVTPLNDAMMGDVETRLREGLAAIDPEVLMKTWMPAGIQGFEQIQKAFWSQFGQGQAAADDDKDD